MECKGIHKERRKSLTFIYAALAVLMLWRALAIRKWFFVPMAVMVIMACFFRREHIISAEGVEIRNVLFGRFTIRDLWQWDEVSSMSADYEKAAPNVQVLIIKHIVIRAFVMSRADAERSFEIAHRMNPGIHIAK